MSSPWIILTWNFPAAIWSIAPGAAHDSMTRICWPRSYKEAQPGCAAARAVSWRDRISAMTNTLTATLRTSQGTIVVRLFPDHAPKTVQNFVELAEGSREWIDPASSKKTQAKLYDGTIFHRVIPRFMIQGGDPLGT